MCLNAEERPKCTVSTNNQIPNESKLVYCMSGYSGFYPPSVNITVDGITTRSISSQKNGIIGGCAIIDKSKAFRCSMKFGSPPIIHPNLPIDPTAPELTTECAGNTDSIERGKS